MKCPVDNETLVMTERSGVEIDYCPACRGVWLDRGELDKIIERAETNAVPSDGGGSSPWGSGHRPQRRKKKKESLLGELFDF